MTTQETPTIDAVEARFGADIHRWPAQENIIKDYLLPLGLDTNHGFTKVAVENSEVAKRRVLTWSSGSPGLNNGHRAQGNERPRPADDGNGSALPTTRAVRNCIEN